MTLDDIAPTCPLMRIAWVGFVLFACANKDMIAEYTATTGVNVPPQPKDGFEAMIDQACGVDAKREEIALAYIQWATETYWGPRDLAAFDHPDDSEGGTV